MQPSWLMTSSKILKVWMGQEFYKLNGVGRKADYDVATLEFRINAWNIEKQHPQCWCRSCMQHYISCSILLWHRRATSENSICTRFFKKRIIYVAWWSNRDFLGTWIPPKHDKPHHISVEERKEPRSKRPAAGFCGRGRIDTERRESVTSDDP